MLYLSQFTFPDEEQEFDFRLTVKRTCYNTMYPFGVLSACGLTVLDFEPLTLLCGGNGSGKTTALNVIGEKLGLPRQSPCNSSSFFGDYAALCRYTLNRPVPHGSRVITSDDVFDFMLDLRALNAGIDRQREDLLAEYADNRHSEFRLKSLADYEQLRRVVDARRMTQSRYTRERMKENVREHSNGESAFSFFTGTIGDDRLFLLDEPENSLSPARQLELARFLEDSVRFFGCQFIIATHSPFLLAMRGARIYDLDANPAAVCRWTEVPAVREAFHFFMEHAPEFGD